MSVDFGVIGGGLVGRIAALALADTQAEVAVWDKANQVVVPSADQPLTLRATNIAFLEKLGIWKHCQAHANPINQLHISSSGRFGCLHICEQDPIAYVMARRSLDSALNKAINASTAKLHLGHSVDSITVEPAGLSCEIQAKHNVQTHQPRRIIVADGAKSSMADQLGMNIVAVAGGFTSSVYKIQVSRWHATKAYQRFYPHGAIGVVPAATAGQCWAIITQQQTGHDQEQTLAEVETMLGIHLGTRLGDLVVEKKLGVYNTTLQYREAGDCDYALNFGNSSINLPPIAAQGLNHAIQELQCLNMQQSFSAWQHSNGSVWRNALLEKLSLQRQRLVANAKLVLAMQCSHGGFSSIAKRLSWAWLGADLNADSIVSRRGQGYYR